MPNYSDSENEIIDRIARNPHPQRLSNNDDSSSSRESSPDGLRRQNRSFTPTSEDGDPQTIPAPDDNTPPRPQKPVIRQALGFASTFSDIATSGTLNTYQAKPTNPAKAKYLPGQTVFPVARTKKPKASGTKLKKTKKKDYATQTGRFRLTDWASSTNNASTSEFPKAPTPSPAQPLPHYNVPPFMNDDHSGTRHDPMPYHMATQAMYSVPPPPPVPNNTAPYFSNTQYMPTRTTPISADPVFSSGSFTAAKFPVPADTQMGSSKKKAPQDFSRSSSYYRRDYENQVDLDLDPMSTPGVGTSTSSTTLHDVPKGKPHQISINQSKPPRPASRMVTILITDMRSGIEDYQLTEVIIPLKATDSEHPEYGFWANAQEVVEELQSSPSRVEGPARAYTMRGKYRQIFMRQQEDGTLEAKPVNISVTSERTLVMVVEKLPALGGLPLPPQIPRDLQPSPEPDELSSNSHFHEFQDSGRDRKRYRSPSDCGDRSTVDYDGISSGRRSRSGSILSLKKKRAKIDEEQILASDAELSISPSNATGLEWNFESEYRGPDDDGNTDAPIVEEIHPAFRMHIAKRLWRSVTQAKARLPCVQAYIELYRILRVMFERYERRRVPLKNRNVRMQKIHILKALRLLDGDEEHLDSMDPDQIYFNCVETLRLLSLYGPGGTRLQDAGVEEMLKDEPPPEAHSKPQERFLRLLREVDEKWQKEHREHAETEEPSHQARSLAQASPAIPSDNGATSEGD